MLVHHEGWFNSLLYRCRLGIPSKRTDSERGPHAVPARIRLPAPYGAMALAFFDGANDIAECVATLRGAPAVALRLDRWDALR